MSLMNLQKGEIGEISTLEELEKTKRQRFYALGFIPGTKVETLHIGMGINIYEVKNSDFAIRNVDAKKIKIWKK
jgi:Fe2+ transport system protein FeoA